MDMEWMTHMERMTQRKQQMSPARRRRVGMRGTTVVELAFMLPFFLLLVLGAFHYGWLFYHLQRVTHVTRHAARVGTLVGRDHDHVRAAIALMLLSYVDSGGNQYYNLDVGVEDQVYIEDVTVTVDGKTVPGIRVAISLPTASNPHVLLIKSNYIPYLDVVPEFLTASVTMAREGG